MTPIIRIALANRSPSMKRTFRFVASRFFTTLAFGATVLAADRAFAGPAADDTGTLDSKLGRVLGAPGGLTSDVVAARAEATSFDIKSKQAELEAAAAGVDQALVAYFPKLSGVARYTRLSPIDQPSLGTLVAAPNAMPGPIPAGTALVGVPLSFPVILNQYLVQATLNVPLSDYIIRIPQSYAAASKNAKAAALAEKATRFKVSADAKATYYAWVRAKLQRVVAAQAVLQAKAHVVDVQNAFDAGTVSRADVLRFESQLAQSQLFLERAESFESIAETQIRVAMHDFEATTYEVGEPVDAETVKIHDREDLASMWAEATHNRLELRTLDESKGSLEEQAKVARAGYWPRVDGVGDVIYANPNQRIFPAEDAFKTTWDVGLQVSWSPNDAATAGASSGSLEARASSLVAQRQSLADAIRIEVTQARNALREARAAIDSSARGLVAAEESYRVRRSLFQNGRSTSVELTDAETDLTRSRLESINARVDLQVARVRLEHALGRDAIARR
jgi:outer membrane protein